MEEWLENWVGNLLHRRAVAYYHHYAGIQPAPDLVRVIGVDPSIRDILWRLAQLGGGDCLAEDRV